MNISSPISVILPVYNHADFLPRALDALHAQTLAPREIVIVDDASTDRSLAVATDFAARPDRRFPVHVLRNAENSGVNLTLNRGLNHVSGEWVACTAADDLLEPRFIEAMSNAIGVYPEARLVTSALVEHFESEDRRVAHDARSAMGLWYAQARPAFFPPAAYHNLLRKGHITLPVSASVIRSEALRAAGGFDPSLRWHSDWFVAHALASNFGFAVVPEHLAVFRIAAGTFSSDNVRHVQRQREVCNAILAKLRAPPWQAFRRALRRAPSPFAPFIRHMMPALLASPRDWDLACAASAWWLGEMARGRRPGPLLRLATRFGWDTVPRS